MAYNAPRTAEELEEGYWNSHAPQQPGSFTLPPINSTGMELQFS